MARITWSGHLSFGLVSVPVQLFVAAREERVDLHMLHEPCGSGVKQKYVCEACGEEVPRTGGPRFYAWDKSTKVVLAPAEIASVDPATSKVSTVLEFVRIDEIDPLHMGASYYLAPGVGGEHAFALLALSMHEMDVGAIAKMTMSGREHLVLIRPSTSGPDGGLGMTLHTLFYADEVRAPDRVPDLSREKFRDQERELAKTLIADMVAPFAIDKYADDRRARLMKLIEAKHDGVELETNVAQMPATEVPDILEALRASIAAKRRA